MLLKTKLFGQVYSFDSVKDVLNKASSRKSGDELIGIAAESEQERIAAQIVISNMQISDFRNNPIIPYEEDFVTRIIQDDLNENIYEEIKNWTIEELREFILSDKNSERDIKRVSRGLTAETISAVCKIMGNLDLAYAGRRIRNETTCNTTMGKRGILASRLQPNHPSDDPDGIRMCVLEGLSYGVGDALIGINPATGSVENTLRVLDMLNEVKEKYGVPTQISYLIHATTMLEAIRQGGKTDLIFASIAGSEKANRGFGITIELLEEAQQVLKKHGTATGPNVLYFETGQGPETVNNQHYGADMATLEARTYGFGKHFNPFIVNDVTGFVGPEVQYDAKQCIRSQLEDHFMGKLSGLPIGTDMAFSSHVKADYDDNDVALMVSTLAGTNYWMGVSGGSDAVDYNMESSFQDLATLRKLCGFRVVREFEEWCQKIGIFDENGCLTDIAGDPSIFM